jgi:hypothetical protein
MSLYDLFLAHRGRLIDKWEHYFPIYERHFAKYVGKSPRVLEIGVSHGGSLQLWKKYFGHGALIAGVDVDERCIAYDEDQISVIIADQTDPVLAKYGPFDIVIDDGSHVPRHQEASFYNLWPNTRGVYMIEDCHDYYPSLSHEGLIIPFKYPWAVVLERPQRMIRGAPSRDLRPDEQEVWDKHWSPAV